jgi:hypothetical protein
MNRSVESASRFIFRQPIARLTSHRARIYEITAGRDILCNASETSLRTPALLPGEHSVSMMMMMHDASNLYCLCFCTPFESRLNYHDGTVHCSVIKAQLTGRTRRTDRGGTAGGTAFVESAVKPGTQRIYIAIRMNRSEKPAHDTLSSLPIHTSHRMSFPELPTL